MQRSWLVIVINFLFRFSLDYTVLKLALQPCVRSKSFLTLTRGNNYVVRILGLCEIRSNERAKGF